MELSPLVWALFTLLLVTGCVAEFCEDDPPKIRNARFKAHTYKNGTILNCECKKGFRRIRNGLPFMLCVGNSSYSSWENKCQCISISFAKLFASFHTHSLASRNKGKQATPKPEEQKERKTTDVQSQMQPMDQANLLGRCREPPPWEHEAMERIYHFMVGQTVYYQCLKGYRALQKRPVKSICKMNCGKTRWTRPRLTCTKEEEHGLLPGKEEPESSTEALADSATSCLLITTDLQEHTELVTTMETLIFTTEYQIAVASCIFLLILFLGGLTWQWRWRKSRMRRSQEQPTEIMEQKAKSKKFKPSFKRDRL